MTHNHRSVLYRLARGVLDGDNPDVMLDYTTEHSLHLPSAVIRDAARRLRAALDRESCSVVMRGIAQSRRGLKLTMWACCRVFRHHTTAVTPEPKDLILRCVCEAIMTWYDEATYATT